MTFRRKRRQQQPAEDRVGAKAELGVQASECQIYWQRRQYCSLSSWLEQTWATINSWLVIAEQARLRGSASARDNMNGLRSSWSAMAWLLLRLRLRTLHLALLLNRGSVQGEQLLLSLDELGPLQGWLLMFWRGMRGRTRSERSAEYKRLERGSAVQAQESALPPPSLRPYQSVSGKRQ